MQLDKMQQLEETGSLGAHCARVAALSLIFLVGALANNAKNVSYTVIVLAKVTR